MRKSSFGTGRPSMSGAPLRIRSGNTNAGPSKRSSTEKPTSTAHGRSSTGAHGRSSVGAHSRMSFVPKTGRPSSGIGVRGRTDTPKDPRPISDKKYQSQCIKQLLEFLVSNNYPHAISHKLLVSPTRKDFFKIFEFIYGKLTPGYKVDTKIEEEVPRVLKMLGYPFTLAKSQLFSVGSPLTWPTVCASLCWMIDLIQFADSLQQDGIENFIFESAVDGREFDGISEEKIIFDYYESTYNAFMSGEDDFTEQDRELERVFKKKYQGGNLDNLVEECRQLESQLEHVEAQENQIFTQKKMSANLHQDQVSTQDYITKLEHYKKSQESEFRTLEEECKMLELQLDSEKGRVSEMQMIYQHQELTPSDVEHLKATQTGLRSQLEQLEHQMEDLDRDNWKVTMEMSAINEKVEKEVATYNRLAIALKLVPETAELAQGKDYRLKAGFNIDIVGHFEHNIKPMLKSLKSHYQDNLRRRNKEKFQLQLELEQFQESVTECRERVSHKEKELASIEGEIDSIKQLALTDKKSQKEELEKLQQTISQSEAVNLDLQQEVVSAQTELQETLHVGELRTQAIDKEMKELEATRREKTARIEEHKEFIKGQLQSYLDELKAANQIMDIRLKFAEEEFTKAQNS